MQEEALIQLVSDIQRQKTEKQTLELKAAHECGIILHEAAAKALKAVGVSRLPNAAALQAEYEKLQAQKEALYADYGKLKKQVREYAVIKQNIDGILRQEKEPERENEKERFF